MITYDDALSHLLARPLKLSCEMISIENATHRILAQDIFCDTPLPRFNNSAMDGYAVRSSETQNVSSKSPLELRVFAHLQAGETEHFYGDASAIKIMTGACVPPGYDAVIPVEQVDDDSLNENSIRIHRVVHKGENIRFVGEDFNEGDMIAKGGTRIAPQHIMALAAFGIDNIPVLRKIRVGIISTGKELKNANETLNTSSIYNSNGPYLLSWLKNLECDVINLGVIPDDVQAFQSILGKAQTEKYFDCLISTGAVSMGDHDFIPSVIQSMGGQILFHKVAIRPGKPILFAQLENLVFFGLPGNPISTAVGCSFFVEPFLKNIQPFTLKAALDAPYEKKNDMRHFLKAFAYISPTGRLQVRILDGQESFKIKSFSKSNCWAILGEQRGSFMEGDQVSIKYVNENE